MLNEGAFKNAPIRQYPYTIKSDIINAEITKEKEYLIDREFTIEVNKDYKDDFSNNINLWDVENADKDYIKDIKVDNISFDYENRENILKDLSLDIKKGEKVAIIGESGSGKSTLLKLMMRFWNVNKGEISIGDENLKNIPTKTLRKSQTLVSQDTFLFNDTILNNIKMGDRNASFEEVVEAAKKASIHEFIMKLPQGYETNVGELGGNLSSGEKQRMSMARAFLRNSDILILDEPTSNLDTLNEASILKSIDDECKDKTIVMVSHRKSSSAICNKRYGLENKKLVRIQ